MGRMEGAGQHIYPNYVFHGTFAKNLPIGPGVFSFDLKYLQHGYYVNMKDPTFDYIGADDEQALPGQTTTNVEPEKGAPRGIVPVWRARYVTEYKPELMPPEPAPIPLIQSELSLLDIIEYLEKHYGTKAYAGEEEEEDDEEWRVKRLVDKTVPEQLDPAVPREVPVTENND